MWITSQSRMDYTASGSNPLGRETRNPLTWPASPLRDSCRLPERIVAVPPSNLLRDGRGAKAQADGLVAASFPWFRRGIPAMSPLRTPCWTLPPPAEGKTSVLACWYYLALPTHPDSHARPYEGEEGEAVPATILVLGGRPDDGELAVIEETAAPPLSGELRSSATAQ
jgi:hypothetical protein